MEAANTTIVGPQTSENGYNWSELFITADDETRIADDIYADSFPTAARTTNDSIPPITDVDVSEFKMAGVTWHELSLLLLLLPLLTASSSFVIILAVKWDERLHRTNNFFAASLSVMHVIMAVTVMPSAMVVTWQGIVSITSGIYFTYYRLIAIIVIFIYLFIHSLCHHVYMNYLRIKTAQAHTVIYNP